MTDAIESLNLWCDHVYPSAILSTNHVPLPMTTVTTQRSWQDSIENRVRWQLRDMLPHDFRMVEGVEVRKLSHKGAGIVYKVNGGNTSLGLDSAVASVVAAARERCEREGER